MKYEFETNEDRYRYSEKKEQEKIIKEYWGENGREIN